MPRLTIPSRVLVTGASGFVASHLCKALLRRGHVVVGTVRSQEKGEFLERLYRHPRFSFHVVEDITQPGAVDHILEGIDGVHHTASPFHFSANEPDEIISPAINGTLGVLQSVKTHGRQVKRVLLTSSTAACINPSDTQRSFNETDWNTWSPSEVQRLGSEASGSDKYQASKAISERAAWAFVSKEQETGNIGWDLTTICPPLIFGPVIHEVPDVEKLNTSSGFFRSWIVDPPPREQVVSPFLNLVDVRDVAEAHVLAMESEKAAGQRLIVSNGPFCIQDIYDELHSSLLSADVVPSDLYIPRGWSGEQPARELQHIHDGSKAIEMLGLEMTSRSDMARDTLASLYQRWPWKA